MLEKIRENSQGLVAQIILGLVILTFAVSGVSSYFGNSTEKPVAVVNGEEISRAQFEQSYQQERARLEQQFGDMFSSLAGNTEYMAQFRTSVLERLIDETLQKQQARELGLAISDDFLKQTIVKMPEFQVDNQFNEERYKALLRQNNLTANQFRDLLREQFSRNQLLVGLAGSEFALPGEVKTLMALQQQTRDIEYVTLDAATYAGNVQITDEKLADYYQLNQKNYALPEKVSLQVVELKGADLASKIEVSDADIETYYNSNKDRYQTAERRRFSHILLESADENAEIKAKAEKLAAELAAGADFATLAKSNSADTISAEKGGDLDFIDKGVMDAEFDNAAFALAKVGDLSPVVKTSFGYHIIKFTGLEEGKVKTLDEVKAQIRSTLQTDKAAQQFADLQQKLAEVSFEIADNLDEAAKAIDAKVIDIAAFERNQAPASFNVPRFNDLVFSADFIASGTNSDIIEIAPQHVVVARLVEHQPAKTQPLEAVKAQVKQAVVDKESAALAKAEAERIVKELETGKALSELVAALGLKLEKSVATPRFGGELDATIRAKAFEMPKPTAEQPVRFAAAELNTGNAAVVVLSKVTEQEVKQQPARDDLARFAEQLGQSHFAVVQKALKDRAEISRHLPAQDSATE